MADTFTLRRGLKNIYVAEVTADTGASYTTGTPYKLIPAGELSVTVENDLARYYFDNSVFAQVGREGSSEITISGAQLRAKMIAAITGKDVDAGTGAILDAGTFVQDKYFALGAEIGQIDGTVEMFWFLKGSFSIPDDKGKTEGEDTDASGTELTYTAIPTVHEFSATTKVCKRVVIDTETTQVKSGSDWFGQVVTPDNQSTIVEAVS